MHLRTSTGLTLIELLLALSLGLVVVTAMTGLFVDTLATNSRSLQSSQLDTEMQAVMALMTAELRQAGYLTNSVAGGQVTDSDLGTPEVMIAQHHAEAPASCVLFQIDSNHNGVYDPVGEALGYRLRNGSVQRRQQSTDCSSNGWQTLTDSNTHRVNDLIFSLAADRPLLTISLTMQSRRHDHISRHRQYQLQLPNVLSN